MDRKQFRKREQFLLCITSLFFVLSLASCAPPCSHRDFLLTLKNTAGFEKVLKRNQEILSMSPKTPPGDEALFNIGLVYAHYRNPKKDYKKSLNYFQRLLREFPRSPFVEEARIWIGVLADIEKTMKVDIEIDEKKKELSR